MWAQDAVTWYVQGTNWAGRLPVNYSILQLISALVEVNDTFAWHLFNPPNTMLMSMDPFNVNVKGSAELYKAGSYEGFGRLLRFAFDYFDVLERYGKRRFEDEMGGSGMLTRPWWERITELIAERPETKDLYPRAYRIMQLCRAGFAKNFGGVPAASNKLVPPKEPKVDRKFDDAFDLMRSVRRSGCMNVTCSLNGPTTGVPQLCSGCGLVRYCNAELSRPSLKEQPMSLLTS